MLFNSYPFIFAFLPLTMFGYFSLARVFGKETAIGWLVICSFVFYGWWNPSYLTLIILSILVNYFLGKSLSKHANKLILAIGVTLNLLALAYYKYFNFFINNLNSFFETSLYIGEILLPLAISFFTFQQIAFLVDAYRGETKEYHFLHYCLFVTFFPQLIAGPIVHHREMLPQFSEKNRFRFCYSNFSIGSTIFLIGLFKKVVIADQFAPYANIVFDASGAGQSISTVDAWGGALAYTFQLYFDFSGYSDMAIGLARMFGIRLPLNFHSPYKSRSIIDFWRRWHMTLSRFLRDYLYISLGGNRKGSFRRYVNLSITMILGGIWHGAGWQFLIWGALHGFYLVVNHLWRSVNPISLDKSQSTVAIYLLEGMSRLLTFLCVVVAWVFFRAESTYSAGQMLQSMFFVNGASVLLTEQEKVFAGIVAAAVVAFYFPNTQQIMARYNPALLTSGIKLDSDLKKWQWQPNFVWGLVFVVAFIWSISSMTNISEFLYFRF